MKIIYISCDGVSVWENEVKSVEFAYDRDKKPYIIATRVEGDTFVMSYDQIVKISDDNQNLKPFTRRLTDEEEIELGIQDVE